MRTGIVIQGNITKIENVSLNSGDHTLTTFTVVDERPMFEPGEATASIRISAEDMDKMPGKTMDDILSTMTGVTNSSSGRSVRGGRPGEGQQYVVDGGATSIVPPRAAIAEVAFIQGAVPAEYENAFVTEIETKSFTREHHGTIEATGSVDGFNNFSLNFGFTGPLVKKKDTEKTVMVGYMIAGAGSYGAGGAVRGGTYRASQNTIDYLTTEPLRRVGDIMQYNAAFVTKYQEGEILSLEEKKGRRLQNAWSTSGELTAKLDIKASKDIDVMVKGSFRYLKQKAWNFTNSLFNSMNNGVEESMLWDVAARLTHRINTAPNSIIKNVYYRLNGYYSRSAVNAYSDMHKDNLFDYGYLGKFEYARTNTYESDLRTWEIDGQSRQAVEMADRDVAYNVTFTPSDKNPTLANYTLQALDYIGSFGLGSDVNTSIQNFGGLLNGEIPLPDYGNIYGLFAVPGIVYDGYVNSLSDVMNVRLAFSFDIKDHSIKIGGDFNQSTAHSHSVSPRSLWVLMRDYANLHIRELDKTNPIPTRDEYGRFTDTVNFNRIVNTAEERQFSKSLRELLHSAADEWIDVDSYDPSMFSLDMFSPEDLFNNGSTLINYYGYDYTGKNKTNKPVTMADMERWFVGAANRKQDALNTIGAYKPIRISAHIQDKFAVEGLYFDLGLRLDIFDKNQPYVKDMYLMRDAYTIGQAQANGYTMEGKIPENIGNDYYVYVQDVESKNMVVTAYRDGNTWYDPNGVEVDNPDALTGGNPRLLPLLKDAAGDISEVNANAFADYKPTFSNGGIALSPRIAFAFTVAENSKFTASYNIITKSNNELLIPNRYLYFDYFARRSGNSPLNNPGLKPEQSIDYEIRFEQALNKNMKFGFSAYYSEKRDQIQVYNYLQAYPASYFSAINMDFGTVQGFVFELEMRRTKNLSFRGSYTLQFAKGTGSTRESTLALIRAGAPNLRTLTLLSYDQRHKINLILQYSFAAGPAYNGPTSKRPVKNSDRVKETRWLEASGISLVFAAGSGFPYTQSSEPYSTIVSVGQRAVKGKISGSRMPWIFDFDLNIWKGFPIVLKNSDEPRARKMGSLEFSLAVQNVLQFDQITSVYSYTGSPTDDGYLTSAKYQRDIAASTSPASYIDYYTIRMEGINRLGAPRTFNLTVSFNF
jgi:outer membrane receptor protein involved in Fe transport